MEDINPSLLFGEFGTFDIERAPRRIFLRISAPLQALRDEILAFSRVGSEGAPIARLIRRTDAEFGKAGKLNSTIVCKLVTQRRPKLVAVYEVISKAYQQGNLRQRRQRPGIFCDGSSFSPCWIRGGKSAWST